MKRYCYEIEVTAEAIDLNGHVNNEVYLHWMIKAATKHSAALGYGYESCLLLGGTWVAKSHHIEYKKAAFEGERLQMQTWIEDAGRTMARRQYQLLNDQGNVVCEGVTEWVFVDAKRMRPMKIPQEILSAFKDETLPL